jgi:hypothetical protein
MIQQQLKSIYDQAVEGWSSGELQKAGVEAAKTGVDAARTGAHTVLSTVRNNPRATVAVILGTGLAAAALWVLREPQRFAAVRRGISGRVRALTQSRRPKRARASRAGGQAKLP